MLSLRTTTSVTLLCLSFSLCFGQLTHERRELGSPDKQVNLNAALSLPGDVTVLFGTSTLTTPYMQATAIAIDAQGNELWRYGYGEPSYNGYSEFFLAVEHANGVRLYAEDPVHYTEPNDLKYIDLDLNGNPLDTTPFTIFSDRRPTSVYQIDTSNLLFLYNDNNEQRIVGIDENGNELYNIAYERRGTFRSESALVDLQGEFGVVHNNVIFAIDFANESVSEIYRVDLLPNGLPASKLSAVQSRNKVAAIGIYEYSNESDHAYLQLNSTGDVVFQQELDSSTLTSSNGDALLIDSIVYIAQQNPDRLEIASFDLSNNGERTFANTVESSNEISLVFPEITILPIGNTPFLFQQFFMEGLQRTFENSIVDIQTLDTLKRFQDYRGTDYFNPVEYVLSAEKIFITDPFGDLLAPGASFTAYDNKTLQQGFSLITEGIPTMIYPMRVDESSQNVVTMTDIYEPVVGSPTTVRRYLYTEAHCFDTSGNTCWSHQVNDGGSLTNFYPTPEGYVWHSRFSMRLDSFSIKSVDGVSGLENWEVNLSVIDDTYISIVDIETNADTTFILLKNTKYGSNSTITVNELVLLAIDSAGVIIWSTRVQEATNYLSVSDLMLDANDSINVFSYTGSPVNNGGQSNENALWTRVSSVDGGKNLAFALNSINNPALNVSGTGYKILDFQRVAFLQNITNGESRTVKLLDLQDTSVVSLISEADVISQLDRFFSIEKRGNKLFMPGSTARHGLGLGVLHNVSFSPRVAPAFQAPNPNTGLLSTSQEIELRQNPVGNKIEFLTRTPVALDEIKLYSIAGREVSGIQVSQLLDGTYQVDLMDRPPSGLYILSIGDASEQVILR